VWGQDFGFADRGDKDSVYARDQMIDEAIRQHEAGAIITLMWHAVRPTDDEPGTFQTNILSTIPPETYADLVTPGTEIHRRWLAQVDVIAGHLRRLLESDVPALWRPYHEMNGNWFWWGNKPGARYIDLWQQLYHRFTHHHGLRNLIWVWNATAPNNRRRVLDYAKMFPGHDYADILATDIYSKDYKQRYYTDLVKLAAGKPVAIGECGEMPTPRILEKQPTWRWFMTWTDHLETRNSLRRILDLYHSPRAIHRDHPTLSWKVWRER
jgi:mannan endo-1,4-beta-mannosidase